MSLRLDIFMPGSISLEMNLMTAIEGYVTLPGINNIRDCQTIYILVEFAYQVKISRAHVVEWGQVVFLIENIFNLFSTMPKLRHVGNAAILVYDISRLIYSK